MADSKLSALTAITYANLAAGDLLYISDISASETKKLAFSELSAQFDLKANLASPTFTGTVSGITKTMVGLSNVDNTTDLLKPISTATQAALDLKANIASPTFTGTVAGITAAMVGLGNVANVDTTTTANITDSSNKRFVTDALLTILGNTSGTNTGDNATNSQYSGLAASKQDALVSGTNIKTVNSNSLLGSGDLSITASAAWGGITGTLAAQTDLVSALALRVPYTGASSAVNFGANNLTIDTNILFVDATNNGVGMGTTTVTGSQLMIQNLAAGTHAISIKAHASQSADMFEVFDDAGNLAGGVTKDGIFYSYGNYTSGNAQATTNTAYGVDSSSRVGTNPARNVSVGVLSLYGTANYITDAVAVGYGTLQSISTSDYCTAVGARALGDLTLGTKTTAVGGLAGRKTNSGSNNTTPTESLFLGYDATPLTATGTNEIVIGANAEGNGSNTVTLGHTTITNTYLRGSIMIPTLTDAAASNSSLYFSSTASKLVWKDAGGTVNNLY